MSYDGDIAYGSGVFRAPTAARPMVGLEAASRLVPPRNERCRCGTSLSRYNTSHQCAVCESRERQERVRRVAG